MIKRGHVPKPSVVNCHFTSQQRTITFNQGATNTQEEYVCGTWVAWMHEHWCWMLCTHETWPVAVYDFGMGKFSFQMAPIRRSRCADFSVEPASDPSEETVYHFELDGCTTSQRQCYQYQARERSLLARALLLGIRHKKTCFFPLPSFMAVYPQSLKYTAIGLGKWILCLAMVLQIDYWVHHAQVSW